MKQNGGNGVLEECYTILLVERLIMNLLWKFQVKCKSMGVIWNVFGPIHPEFEFTRNVDVKIAQS